MIPPPPAGLPVISTRTVVLDIHHRLMKQETARGDCVYVQESLGQLVEIAVVPIDGQPIARWQEFNERVKPAVEKEYDGYDPMRPETHPQWRRLDEESWPREMAKLMERVLAWYMENAGRDAVLLRGNGAGQSEV